VWLTGTLGSLWERGETMPIPKDEGSMHSRAYDLRRFGLLYLLGVMANACAGHQAPLVSQLASTLGKGAGVIGVAMGAQFAAYLLGGAAVGKLVAQIGQRRASVYGLSLIALTCISNYYASTFVWLAADNLLQGLGMLVIVVAAQVGIADQPNSASQGRALAIWATSPIVGLALGLLLSSSVADAPSWRLAFLCMAAVAGGLLIMVLMILPPKERQKAEAPVVSEGTPLRQEVDAIRLSLAVLLAVLTLSGSVNLWPTFLAELHHISVGAAGARSSFAMLVGIAGSLLVAAALAAGWRQSTLLLAIVSAAIISVVIVLSGVGGVGPGTIGIIGWNVAAGATTALAFATLPLVLRHPQNLPAATGLLYQISSIGAICGAPLFLTIATWPRASLALAMVVIGATVAMATLFPVWRPNLAAAKARPSPKKRNQPH
jgi:MFS family permease